MVSFSFSLFGRPLRSLFTCLSIIYAVIFCNNAYLKVDFETDEMVYRELV